VFKLFSEIDSVLQGATFGDLAWVPQLIHMHKLGTCTSVTANERFFIAKRKYSLQKTFIKAIILLNNTHKRLKNRVLDRTDYFGHIEAKK
jgi:hypothetical protein